MSLIPFDQYEELLANVSVTLDLGHVSAFAVNIIVLFWSCLFSSFVIYIVHSKSNFRSASNQLLSNLCLANFAFCFVNLVLEIGTVAGGKWFGGITSCILSAICNIFLVGVLTQIMALTAKEQYDDWIHNNPWSLGKVQAWTLTSWFACVAIVLAPILSNHFVYFGLKSSGLYCCGMWSDTTAPAIIASALCLAMTTFGILVTIIYVFKSIKVAMPAEMDRSMFAVIKYSLDLLLGKIETLPPAGNGQNGPNGRGSRTVTESSVATDRSRMQSEDTVNSNHAVTPHIYQRMILLRKLFLMVNLVSYLWAPFMLGYLYEVITKTESPRVLDTFATIFVNLYSLSIPLIIIYIDPRYTRALYKLLMPGAYRKRMKQDEHRLRASANRSSHSSRARDASFRT